MAASCQQAANGLGVVIDECSRSGLTECLQARQPLRGRRLSLHAPTKRFHVYRFRFMRER